MRRVSVARILAAVAVACLAAGPVFAEPVGGGSTTAPVGVMFNVAGTVLPGFQVVGDLGYSHKDGVSFSTFTGGVRYLIHVDPTGSVVPFVEGLVGGGRVVVSDVDSLNGFAYGVGAGVDVKVFRNANARFQVNYFRTQRYGVTFDQFRFGAGVSFGGLIRAAGGWAPSRLSMHVPVV